MLFKVKITLFQVTLTDPFQLFESILNPVPQKTWHFSAFVITGLVVSDVLFRVLRIHVLSTDLHAVTVRFWTSFWVKWHLSMQELCS